MIKKLLGILVIGLLWCNVGFAKKNRDWIKTDYTISYYLKNNWKITFVNQKNDYKTIYTLQKDHLIVSCRIEDYVWETCYKPAGQED